MYSENGISPTLHGIGCGGNTEPKIAIIDDMYANREPRVYKEYSPTLRSERQGLKVIEKIKKKINRNWLIEGMKGF